MSMFAVEPNLGGISNAINKAADAINDPKALAQDVAKNLIADIAKALDPRSKPEDTLNKFLNNGIDEPSQRALGAFMSVFKLGMDMSFSGIINQGMSNNFTSELLKFLAPEAMQQFENVAFNAGLDTFRAWKN